MRQPLQHSDGMHLLILMALLTCVPCLAPAATSAVGTLPGNAITMAGVAPTNASQSNAVSANAARSRIPAPNRSQMRTKAGVLATGALIAITILIVACGLALLSSFKKR